LSAQKIRDAEASPFRKFNLIILKHSFFEFQAFREHDIIFDMNNRKDVPGYGYQIAKGATALTESWQALPNVSNNHFMLGHLMEWLYSGIGGIGQTEQSLGYKTVLIDPQIVGDITSATTSYESPYGLIRCGWKKEREKYELKVSVPANSEAVISLPAATFEDITDYGVALTSVTDIINMEVNQNGPIGIKLKVGSGNYLFTVNNPVYQTNTLLDISEEEEKHYNLIDKHLL
jgi:hypothetical protein